MDPVLVFAKNAGPFTGHGNNTWLLDGAEPTLIDAGIGQREHIEDIGRALAGRPLARVLVTHGHADHASGLPALRAHWPHLDARKWPSAGEQGWRPLTEGERIPTGNAELVVVHTPGHAPDHVCFHDPVRGDLYGGDMVAIGTTVMIPAGRGGNLRAYLSSLARMAALEPRRILPAHGPVIVRPLELIAEYIEHRRMRERQVRQCLLDGVTDTDSIVARIYPDLALPLRPAAAMTVEAHLVKLREEGFQ